MNETTYRPDASLKPRIAATELLFGAYRWGEVHEKNALAMGGVCGHAGLFSTAGDLARYAASWLQSGAVRLLSDTTIATALRNHAQSAGANRGLGWVLKGDRWDSTGDLSSEASFGHTGFTGTSLFLDPVTDVFVVLLTNRIHYGREKSVARLRDCFHNAITAAVSD